MEDIGLPEDIRIREVKRKEMGTNCESAGLFSRLAFNQKQI